MAGCQSNNFGAQSVALHRRSISNQEQSDEVSVVNAILRRPASRDPLQTPSFGQAADALDLDRRAHATPRSPPRPLAPELRCGLLPLLRERSPASQPNYGATTNAVPIAQGLVPPPGELLTSVFAPAEDRGTEPVAPRSLWVSLMLQYGAYGAALGGWGVRLPEFKDGLALSDGAFAALLVCNVGGYLAAHEAHVLVERHIKAQQRTLRPLLPLTSVALPLSLALISHVKTFEGCAVAMACSGVLSELLNHDLTHVVSVLKRDGAEHADEMTRACFAAGELFGSTLGLIVTVRGGRVSRHMLEAGGALAALGGAASLWGPRALPLLDDDTGALIPKVSRSQLLLDTVGIFMAIGHTAIANWIGIYLRDNLGASEVFASAGYVLFAAGAFVGELFSSHLIGPPHVDPRILLLASISVPVALALAVGLNGVYSVLVGAGTAGAGLGVYRPAATQAASRLALTRQAPPPVLGVLSGLQNAGFLFGNIFIGVAAQRIDLRAALIFVGVSGLVKLFLSSRLRVLLRDIEQDFADLRAEDQA